MYMNITNILNRLPVTLRGRFASSNNQWWIDVVCDAISEIERISVGPGQIRQAQAFQLKSGFIPLPKVLHQISGAWLDGKELKLVEKDNRGFQLERDSVTFEKHEATVEAPSDIQSSISFSNPPAFGDALPSGRVVEASIDASGEGLLTLISGDPFVQGSDNLLGFPIWFGESLFHVKWSLVSGSDPKVASVRLHLYDDVPRSERAVFGGFTEDCLDGAEVHCGNDQIVLSSSSWSVPKQAISGWTSPLYFTCERAHPGRTWISSRPCYILKSNLVLEGYRALARPSTITEELDLPGGTEKLLEAYLLWKANDDMERGGRDAKSAEADFEKQLHKYVSDQSKSDGTSMPRGFNMKPSFFGGRY